MGVTIELWKPTTVSFDLDTIRPIFNSKLDRDAHFNSRQGFKYFGPIVWLNPGDPIVIYRYQRILEGFTVGRLNLTDTEYNEKYYFTVQKLETVGEGKTKIYMAIDWELTHMVDYKNAYILRCPLDSVYAAAQDRGAKRYELDTYKELISGWHVAIIVKGMKRKREDETPSIDGPIYILTPNYSSPAPGVPGDAVQRVLRQGLFESSDIIGVYMVPALINMDAFERTGWENFPPIAQMPSRIGIWTNIRQCAFLEKEYLEDISIPTTDLNQGVVSGFCDNRGNILYNIPYGVTVDGFKATLLLGAGECSCVISLRAQNTKWYGYFGSQVAGLSFSISCPTLDLIGNEWNEYSYRQREIDIRARHLGNVQSLVSNTLNPVNIATSAIAGGPAGIAASVGSGLMNFGLNSYFGNRQQELTDLKYKMAQNILQIVGAGNAYDMVGFGPLWNFVLKADDVSMKSIEAENKIMGVSAYGFTHNMKNVLKEDLGDNKQNRPWAFAPVLDMVSLPANEKDTIRATCSKGCRWVRF